MGGVFVWWGGGTTSQCLGITPGSALWNYFQQCLERGHMKCQDQTLAAGKAKTVPMVLFFKY